MGILLPSCRNLRRPPALGPGQIGSRDRYQARRSRSRQFLLRLVGVGGFVLFRSMDGIRCAGCSGRPSNDVAFVVIKIVSLLT